MITRQRLGQLIKEETIIYTTRFGGKKPEKFKLHKDFYMSQKDTLCCLNKSQEFLVCEVKFKYLFETKEEAEWQLEFGNIQRTETLSLPSWEEFIKINYFPTIYCNYCKTITMTISNNEFFLFSDILHSEECIYRKPLTKENYVEACKLCLRLFKGEEVC